MNMSKIKIIECPRDAMQGLDGFIPTDIKVRYLNKLLEVGFDTLDFGSFVSPIAIPQMKDTAEIVSQLNLSKSKTKLLAIVANLRGAKEAASFKQIQYLGYPMSISETFQYKNTNKSIIDSLEELSAISEICQKKGKELVVYISMAFGNPYGDQYSTDLVSQYADVLVTLGASVISLADTVGLATPKEIKDLYSSAKQVSQEIEWGVHLHATNENSKAKVIAAIDAGCRRIDGAILGFGGCPMADNDLVGNVDTRTILATATEQDMETGIDISIFKEAEQMASSIFLS